MAPHESTASRPSAPGPLVAASTQVAEAIRGYYVGLGDMPEPMKEQLTREFATELEKRGTKVRYAIHPVAGRMPGHMNVLLAEADVPYEQLVEMDLINGDFADTDVSIILGANDVVNPVANKDPSSPIYGMPILNAYESQSVFVVKRSLSPGYAGIKNELFEYPNTMMIFGDAKDVLQSLIAEVKAL